MVFWERARPAPISLKSSCLCDIRVTDRLVLYTCKEQEQKLFHKNLPYPSE